MKTYEPSEKDKKNIENNFKYHPATEDTNAKYEEIRATAKAFAMKLTLLCPPSRELSVAITELETAVFWANAAIARNE